MNELQREYLRAKARYQAAFEAMRPYDEAVDKVLHEEPPNFDKAVDIEAEGARVTGWHQALDAKIAARETLLRWVEQELRGDPRWSQIAPLFQIKSVYWREKAADFCTRLDAGRDEPAPDEHLEMAYENRTCIEDA